MGWTRACSPGNSSPNSGIALFMVIAAMSVLSILVTEFVYIAQMNQAIAFDGLDQLKAHYLAKSGLKLSLLRLKAYLQVKSLANTLGGAGGTPTTGSKPASGSSAIPKGVLDKIWSFPFFYPIPTDLPGISIGDKEKIQQFQKDSNLEGSFSAVIESESSKYNLNMILPQFAPSPSPSASASPGATPTPTPTPGVSTLNSSSPPPGFSADDARTSLSQYLAQLMANKLEDDQDFAQEYRDYNMDDLMDSIIGWADLTYQRRNQSMLDDTTFKQAPFYSVTELHMLPLMDDQLYDLFTPNLTVSATQGIDINTMQDTTLRALVPLMTKDEITALFKFRDDPDSDNTFKSSDDFFKYLMNNVAAYLHNQAAIDQLKQDLGKRNIQLVTDETDFKITVQAHVNQAVRTITAYVTLTGTGTPSGTSTSGSQPAPPPPVQSTTTAGGAPPQVDPGLKITFLRIE